MTTNLTAVTEASDKYFQHCFTSVCSFLEKNNWFNGDLCFLISETNPISKPNRNILSSIYPNVSFLRVTDSKVFKKAFDKFHISHRYPQASIQDLSKLAVFDSFGTNVLYFSNFSLFMGDVKRIVKPSQVTYPSEQAELFYLDKNINLSLIISNKIDDLSNLTLGSTYSLITEAYCSFELCIKVTGLAANSVEFIDSKFVQLQPKLKNTPCIHFNNLLSQNRASKTPIVSSLSRSTSKINRLWLQQNKEYSKKLASASSKFIYDYVNSGKKEEGSLSNTDINRKVNFFLRESMNREETRHRLDKLKLINSIKETDLVLNGRFSETPPLVNHYEVACVIAFKGRHKMVELNVLTLCNQTLIPAIVLVASNQEDVDFCERLRVIYRNVFLVIHQNYPIGGKWQAGVDYARKLGVKGLMILGSDDMLSLGYVEECFSKIDMGLGSSGNGVDLVGKRSWYIYDLNTNLYFLEYTEAVTIFLGGGKMFSKNFLDKVDWHIFREFRPFHLDEQSYFLVKTQGNSIGLVSDREFILSIKGPWEVLNKTSDILKASKRITNQRIDHKKEEIFNSLKITNIDDYLK